MKKLVIALFVITLLVFAGDKPTAEIEKNIVEYHTRDEWRALPWSHKRKLTSGLSVLSGLGLALAGLSVTLSGNVSGDVSGELLGVGIAYLGVGLGGAGCYLAFRSKKE